MKKRFVAVVATVAVALSGCATGDPELDRQRTEAAQLICQQGCAASAREGLRRCDEKPDEVSRIHCAERVMEAEAACMVACSTIRIDGKVGGIDVGG